MKRFLPKNLIPKSLGGQLVALLLIGLVLSQGVALLVLVDERREAIRASQQFGSVERMAEVVRLVQDTPPALRERTLAALSSRRVQLWISDTSPIRRSGKGRRTRWLLSLVRDALPAESRQNVRLRFVEDDNFERLWRLGRGNRGKPKSPYRRHDDDDDDDDHHDHDYYHDHDGRGLALSVPLQGGGWLNAVARIQPRAIAWAWPSLVSMGLMGLIILGGVFVMARRITRPLQALSEAAARLGRGENTQPLPAAGPVEVRRTTEAFNEMQERLSRFIRDRTTLLAAISHDLRTPITSLRLRAELVEDGETRAKLLETLEEMQRMTEATLSFAREEAAQEETRQVDLTSLVQSLCDDLADLGHDVVFDGHPRLAYDCRPTGLKRALRNLIENAIHYGKLAKVGLSENEDAIVISVEDEGPGIAPEDFARVFEPFVRLEESRSRETGGIGLGLAIARSIARAHGGDVTLENRPEGGLRVFLTLPKAV